MGGNNHEQEIVQEVQPDMQQEINNQFSDALEVLGMDTTEKDQDEKDGLADEEETFPTTGPYQCELCDCISETKQDFLNDIREKHMTEIDQEVLDALEKDVMIQAAKRRAGRIQ